MRRATTDTANIPPLRGSQTKTWPRLWSLKCLYCRSASSAPLLQPAWPPCSSQPHRRTKVPREWRRGRWSSRPGQLLRLRQSGVSGRSSRPQPVSQGVCEQLLLSWDVSSTSSHVPASPPSPVSWAGHLLPSCLHLHLTRTPPGSPHGRLRHYAAHLTSQRTSSSTSWWSVAARTCPMINTLYLAPISVKCFAISIRNHLKFNYRKVMQILIGMQINLNLFELIPKNSKERMIPSNLIHFYGSLYTIAKFQSKKWNSPKNRLFSFCIEKNINF